MRRAECTVLEEGRACDRAVATSVALSVCTHHLLAAYELVAGDVGVTDLLPSPCVACGSRLGVHYPSGWLCAHCEWRHGEHPDLDGAESGRGRGETGGGAWATAARVDVVYYLRYQDRIKIGTSGGPRGRLAQIRHDELLAFERGARALEQKRHAQFAAHRLGGEWFAADDELLAHIASLGAGLDDPWQAYALWVSEAVALRGSQRV